MPGRIGHGRVLAQLQRANVSNDAPPVARRNLRSVIGHGAEALGHDLEKISERGFSQALVMIGRRMPEATLRDHSIAVSSARMAWRTINVKSLAPAIQVGLRDRKRHIVPGIAAHFARIKICIFVNLAASNRSIYRHSRRAQIGIKIALRQRLEARLIVHVLAAASKRQQYCEPEKFSQWRHLAWHLRHRKRTQAFKELSRAHWVVIPVGRKNDNEE